jgi:hypothetical protein
MKFKKIIFIFVICFIFVLGFAFAQECGDGICDEGEEATCIEDCFTIPDSGICGDGVCEFDEPTYCSQDCPDISEEEYLLETVGSEYLQQTEESGEILSEQTDPLVETEAQETTNVNVFGFSFNIIIFYVTLGIIVFIVIFIVIFFILKKKKSPEKENVSQTPTVN